MALQPPASLKGVANFLRRADEVERGVSRNPDFGRIVYYCRLAAAEMSLRDMAALPAAQQAEANAFLTALIEVVERNRAEYGVVKEREGDDLVLTRNYALTVLKRAEDMDRAGLADKDTVRTYAAAGTFLDVVRHFLPAPDAQLDSMAKFAKGRAADIMLALSQGRPVEPPPGAPMGYTPADMPSGGGGAAESYPALPVPPATIPAPAVGGAATAPSPSPAPNPAAPPPGPPSSAWASLHAPGSAPAYSRTHSAASQGGGSAPSAATSPSIGYGAPVAGGGGSGTNFDPSLYPGGAATAPGGSIFSSLVNNAASLLPQVPAPSILFGPPAPAPAPAPSSGPPSSAWASLRRDGAAGPTSSLPAGSPLSIRPRATAHSVPAPVMKDASEVSKHAVAALRDDDPELAVMYLKQALDMLQASLARR